MKSENYIPALSYDWLTPFYDSVVGFTTRERLFKQALVLQAGLASDQRILDLGCGTGTLTILLKEAAPLADVVGLDGDPGVLKIASEKVRESFLNIGLDEGMSFDLPYQNRYFDRVVSSLFFHHLTTENKVKTLGEIKRVLKPGGEFHIADWGKPSSYFMRLSSRLIQLLDGFETTADNFNGLIPQLMEQAGFGKIEETNHFNTLFGTIRLHRSCKI